MSQQKSTSFSAARVANFVVVMAEMFEERLKLEREIKRLRHHVSVLSKRNYELMKDGKSRAVASIASATSLCSCRGEEKEGVADSEAEVAVEVATVEAEEEVEGVAGKGKEVAEGVAEDEAVASKEGLAGSVVASVAESEAVSEAGEGSSEGSVMEIDERVEDLRSRISDEDVLVDGKIVPLKGYESKGLGVRGAPLGPKKSHGRGDFVSLGPYGFRNVIGGRGRGGGIGPGVAQGAGQRGKGRGGSTGVAWNSSGLGTLAPRPG